MGRFAKKYPNPNIEIVLLGGSFFKQPYVTVGFDVIETLAIN
jgi:hypothetical protein